MLTYLIITSLLRIRNDQSSGGLQRSQNKGNKRSANSKSPLGNYPHNNAGLNKSAAPEYEQ